MYSRETIAAALRARGKSDDEIDKIMNNVAALKTAGLIKTRHGGNTIGLTVAGRKQLAELRASGAIPPR